jgi:hypothetical protein
MENNNYGTFKDIITNKNTYETVMRSEHKGGMTYFKSKYRKIKE